MMKSLKILLAALILMLPLGVMAHGYWIETEGTHKVKEAVTVKLYFGEYVAGERVSGKSLDKMKDIVVYVSVPGGEKQAITMTQQQDFWTGSFIPQSQGTYIITGINDVREVQDWNKHNLGIVRPIQYLKAEYQVGKKETSTTADQLLDINVDKQKDGKYTINVSKGGKALASQKVILNSFTGDEDELMTDKNGNASFTLKKPALYLLSLDWIDPTPGEYKDKKYETVRHRLDVSLYH